MLGGSLLILSDEDEGNVEFFIHLLLECLKRLYLIRIKRSRCEEDKPVS